MDHFYSSASSIQYIMDIKNNFPPALINMIKDGAYNHSGTIISTGDRQLIEQLLFNDGQLYKPSHYDRAINEDELLPNAPPAEQLAHIEMMFRQEPSDDGVTLEERSLKHLESSKSKAFSILSQYSSLATTTTHSSQVGDCIGDEQRMVFLKLGERRFYGEMKSREVIIKYLIPQYVLTGDCMLIPYIIERSGRGCNSNHVSNLIKQIIRHGNIYQIIVAHEVLEESDVPEFRMDFFNGDIYNSFLEADDVSNSLEVIKYLNSKNVVQRLNTITINPCVLNDQQLKFMMSDDNKIFEICQFRHRLLLLEAHHIDYVLQVKPSFFQPLSPNSGQYLIDRMFEELNIIIFSLEDIHMH
ncbi:hypothetical protein SAMD00019534_018260 [Acytostelium subglobosum LB1]|uniref:hypothetical protein n=1 Tax=Acytostelium subglobosum LB1 TaxID=1410327 RepID=UPI00064501EF|nr:hypothetical protein SAMD00019534_018260 [Acytostelium subglobosum LB1]GAM18651.1 hypothetical protein SAMD00019534_018260 [Acytostelium subglobosum LB1]|eukprot:XP_012757871.1 hypothetical protein SAMD00019534_018260 [Acytostelium subglobosum LB1]